jgi:hypothetical protein
MGGDFPTIPLPSLRRLPIYYRRLKRAMDEGLAVISSQELGESATSRLRSVRRTSITSVSTGGPGWVRRMRTGGAAGGVPGPGQRQGGRPGGGGQPGPARWSPIPALRPTGFASWPSLIATPQGRHRH